MDKKIKIAYLDQSHIFSGAENSLLSLVQHLDVEKYEPTLVFIYPHEHQKRYDVKCEKICLEAKIQWWMGSDRWQKPIRGTDLIKRIVLGYKLASWAKTNNIDIVHINLMNPKSFWWGVWLKLFVIKSVAHARSEPWSWIPSTKVQKQYDVIISVSDFVKNRVQTKFLHPNITSIYDPVERMNDNSQMSREILFSRLGVDEFKNIVSSVGLLAPHKGHEMAILVFSALSKEFDDLVLVIAGGGSNDELERLKQIVEDEGMIGKVVFTEKQIDFVESVYMYSKFVFSLTIPGEAFGRVPFEAALCGAVTIAPTKGAVVELIEDQVSGFLADPLSKEEVLGKARYILNHPDESEVILKRLQEKIKDELSAKAYANKVTDIYRNLMLEQR